MPKSSLAIRGLPTEARQSLVALGHNLGVVRHNHGLTQAGLAERMMVNVETVSRMERGDAGVGVGIWASALWLLGQSGRMVNLLAVDDGPETLADESAGVDAESSGPPRNDF